MSICDVQCLCVLWSMAYWNGLSVRYRQTNQDGSHAETVLYNLKDREVMMFTLQKLRVTSDQKKRCN